MESFKESRVMLDMGVRDYIVRDGRQGTRGWES